jgi:hypothetical protein
MSTNQVGEEDSDQGELDSLDLGPGNDVTASYAIRDDGTIESFRPNSPEVDARDTDPDSDGGLLEVRQPAGLFDPIEPQITQVERPKSAPLGSPLSLHQSSVSF